MKTSNKKKEKAEHWCYICNRKFAQQASLQRHNKQHHGQNTEENRNYTITKSVTITETVSVTNNAASFNEKLKNGEYSNFHGSTNGGFNESYGNSVQSTDGYYQNYGDNYGGEMSDNQYTGSFKNSDFYNQGVTPETSGYYYEGNNTYQTEEGSQHGSLMSSNYGEEYYSEQYKSEDVCQEEYGDYKDQYFVDIPSENSQENGSYNYEESNYTEEQYFENYNKSNNEQICESSFLNSSQENGNFETEDGTCYNYDGDWDTNELNSETYSSTPMEAVNKRQPNSVGSGGGFNCSQCTKTFSNKSNLNRHFNSTHCFPCKVCSQKFVDKVMMETHYKEEHLINCNVCGKTFSNKSNLNRHIKTAHVT